jgi:Peptidase family M50
MLALFIALGAHELGHLTAGLLVRFRFFVFAIGPLLVERSESGALRLRINRVPFFFGGIAGTYPVDTARLPARLAVAIAGGPVASLLLALLAALLLGTPGHLHPAIRVELQWLRLVSGLLFLGTAVPFWNGPFVTDGLRFLRTLSRGPHGMRELSNLNLTALQMSGTAASGWDPALVSGALVPADGSIFEHEARLFSYLHALDAGEIERAGDHLDHAMRINPKLPSAFRISCLLEATYFEARHRHRVSIAREHLERVPADPPPGIGFLESDRLRARAAIALENGDHPAAAQAVSRALELLPSWNVWARARLLSLGSEIATVDERSEPAAAPS